MTQPQNILIVRTDRIGDVLLSLPMASVIKKHYPDTKITFMLREYTKPLAVGNPSIDEIILLKEKNGKVSIAENVNQIKQRNFDTCIVVYPTFRISLFLFCARIKNRIGTGYRWYSFVFNKKIFVHRKHGKLHELEHNINMLEMIGIDEKPEPGNVPFNIHISGKSRQKVDEILRKHSINREIPALIIHPGSGGSSVDWPVSSFIELIHLLARELNINILITGGKNEFEICEKLVVHKKVVNLAGQFELDEMIALTYSAEILIANSTGPIHIAAALDKQVIGFYPKINHCSQKRWGPYTRNKIIFEPNLCDGNCTRKQCEELNCMTSIKVKDVFESIKKLLANSNAEN
ncbi:glycosyltransferase family 9 protein [Bacteroidota bacterium]